MIKWRYITMKQKLFRRDFTLVAIGQIISLFGNAALRFALPLYLLNQTGSSRLYGLVTACAFIPAILLSPVGGIAADRFNKRNIMVLLDFFTAALIIAVSLLLESVNLVTLLAAALMLFYGIAGAYQPAVQASVPALVEPEQLMQANSVINMIASLAALAGPALGGILYSVYGLKTVLAMCAACFTTSAIMELFIRIPFVKQPAAGSMWQTVKTDIAGSVRFIAQEKPAIGRVMLVVCGVNLTLSSMIVVGIPYLVTEVLPLESSLANTLCGFAQGALAAGSLTGGICAGVFAERLSLKNAGGLIAACAVLMFPIGIGLAVCSSGMVNYGILTVCCFGGMVVSTLFTVQMMSFIQAETPRHLTGKVIAVILAIANCAQPLGNALYGVLFEACSGFEFAVALFSCGTSLLIALGSRKIFRALG